MQYADCEFVGQEVELDDNEFTNCHFVNCQLVFRGGKVAFIGCRFEAPQFVFRDAAQATLGFLAALYRDGGGPIVEDIFQAIRQPRTLPPSWEQPNPN
jgi:hypothetical protein